MGAENIEGENKQFENRPFRNLGWEHDVQQRQWKMHLGRRRLIRMAVLKILQEKPMNGVELMARINEMSRG